MQVDSYKPAQQLYLSVQNGVIQSDLSPINQTLVQYAGYFISLILKNQMSLTQDFADANFIITGYQPGCVLINNEPHTRSLVVCPDRLITPWEVTSVDQLNENSLAAIINLQPEVVLLGTGDQLILPEPKILVLFAQYKIGLETMNTNAACRTYGILIAEGRRAATALIFPD